MNNYCTNCGEKLEANVKSCPKCNNKILYEKIHDEDPIKYFTEVKDKEKKYLICISGLYVLGVLLGSFNNIPYLNFLAYFSPLFYWASIIILIYARFTLRDSKIIKILLVIVLVLLALYLLYMFLIAVTYCNIIRGCDFHG